MGHLQNPSWLYGLAPVKRGRSQMSLDILRPDHMLRPDHASLFSQGVRFAFTGCVVSAIYLLTTSALALIAGLPFQAALVIGFVVSVAVHFGMQRLFVWTDHDGFALAAPHQIGRYLVAATTQYGVTAVSTSLLPAALGWPVEVVYLAIAFPVALVNFVLFRNYIFHGKVVKAEAHGELAWSPGQGTIVLDEADRCSPVRAVRDTAQQVHGSG